MRSTKSTNRAEALRIAIAWENASREGATKARAIAIIDQLLPTTSPSILAHQHLPAWLNKRYPIAPCPIAQCAIAALLSIIPHDTPLAAITTDTLLDLRLHLIQKKYRPSTIARYLGAIRTALIDALDADLIPRLPKKIPRISDTTPEPKTFTHAQIQTLLQHVSIEWQSMILTGIATGLRINDISALRADQIDIHAHAILTTPRKTRRRIWIPVPASLIQWWQHHHMLDSTHIHPTISRQPRHSNSREFVSLTINAGIQPTRATQKDSRYHRGKVQLTFHSLRHTTVSLLKSAGVADAIVMEFVGHSTLAMSQHYTHTSKDALRAASATIPLTQFLNATAPAQSSEKTTENATPATHESNTPPP